MATIDSLPPETLIRILELAADNPSFAAASLVCRRWRDLAQALLWHRVSIYSEGDATRIFSSPVYGKYRSPEVLLRATGLDWPAETVEGALGGLAGVESLTIYTERNDWIMYDADWLNLASLRGLKTLDIDAAFFEAVPPSVAPSFHLRTLTVTSPATPAHLAHTLLAASASSLLSLTLALYFSPVISPVLSSLPLVATTLTTLTLKNVVPGLGPALSSFSALSHLVLHINETADIEEYEPLLAALPAPVESVTIVLARGSASERADSMKALAEAMRRKTWERAVTELHLYLKEEKRVGGGAEAAFLEVCVTRGVAVRFVELEH